MDQEIEVLPSSSGFHHTHSGPIVRRPIVGIAGGAYAGGHMLPSQRGAGVPPSLLRVERQLPLSFQRTNQHYDTASRQTGTRNGKVVLLPRVNTVGAGGRMVPRTITPYSMDASGNRYVVTANGRLAQIQPTTRMNMTSAPLRRNYLLNQQQQRYQSVDVKPFAYGNNRIGGYETGDVRQPTYIRQVGGYSSLTGRQMVGGDGRRLHPTGFRRVDYTAVPSFRGDGQAVKREPSDWPPRLIPVGGAPGGGYRVASNNSPPPPTTRLRPVNPRRAFGPSTSGSGSGIIQIRLSDSPDMRVCKSIMRDILDEVCGPDVSNARPDGTSLGGRATASIGLDDLGFGGTSLKLEPASDDVADGRESADRLPSDQSTLTAAGSGLSVQWQDQSIQQHRPELEEVPEPRIRPRVSSPVARQIVSMRDIYELPFDHIARHFKLEPHVVRFAYIQLKKHSFRSVGRPRKSESEERRHNAGDLLMMPYAGRLPSASHLIANPAVPLRYPSDELNVFLDAYRKEVMKRRLALERRAEDEIGIVMPWNRGRSKNVKSKRTS